MANNKIQTTDLDFDGIKASLKNFLSGQQKFSDYDFEGSALSIILDVLAYNTHFNALYLNLATNEAFLDSASKRDSVVSKAKELGYVPNSIESAKATVNIVLSGNVGPSYTIPKYTQFKSKVGDKEFSFYTTTTYNAERLSGFYTYEGVELTQGTLLDYSFEADGLTTSFTLPNTNVDLSSLVVVVQETPEASGFETYLKSDNVLEANGSSLIYFVKEVAGGRHQIEFGNGVVGKALEAGNIVTVTYMVSAGDAANSAKSFTFAASPSGLSPYVSTTAAAFGGAPAEDIEDIKWNAPRAFVAQNRCVTVEDFKTVVNSEYPHAASINVWGGEDNNPPTYGNVYIAVKPEGAERLSEGEKDYLLNTIIKPRCTLTIHPKIVDPEYLYVEPQVAFYYAPTETNKTDAQLTESVRDAIVTYNDNTLAKFGGVLKGSVLSRIVDTTDECIKSSVTTLLLKYKLKPVYDRTSSYEIKLGNPIYNSGVAEQSVTSTGLSILEHNGTVYFEDEPTAGSSVGKLRLYYLVQNKKTYLPKIYGTIDYDTGKITIVGIIILGIVGTDLEFIIKPQSSDVAGAHNRIVTIVLKSGAVVPVVDQIADKYRFTSARN